MPLNDAGYFVSGNAFVYRGAENATAPLPTALASPGAAFTLIGHLGLEDGTGMPEFTFEGGEVTPKGSMSKKVIRSVVTRVVRQVEWSLSQFDRSALGLYFGGTGGSTSGVFGVSGAIDGTPTRHSLLFTFQDGSNWIGFFAPSVDTIGADTLSTADIENALLIPLRSTLNDPTTGDRFQFISSTLLAIP